MDKVQKIRETVENRYEYWKEKESNSHSIESEIRMSECEHLLLMFDSQEEPVSEDLEKAAVEAFKQIVDSGKNNFLEIFKAGAKWQKKQMMKDTIEGNVLANGMGEPILHLWNKGKHLIDKKVKVVVIEEE